MWKKFVLVLLICWVSLPALFAQNEITEENYLRQDSVLWSTYYERQDELSRLWKVLPEEKHDSLQVEAKVLLDDALRENACLAIRFASVPSGLQRLYKVRLGLSKDTLTYILNTLTPEMRDSFYGMNIQEHISCHQIVEGDALSSFPCTQADGMSFDWSVLQGKQVMLLCGGLSCMGKTGRAYLDRLYAATSRENFLIVVYCLSGSLNELQETQARYGGNYIYISDFKQDSSPMKIRYGCQATPTCFLTDSLHRVLVKCTGLGGVQEYIEKNGYF